MRIERVSTTALIILACIALAAFIGIALWSTFGCGTVNVGLKNESHNVDTDSEVNSDSSITQENKADTITATATAATELPEPPVDPAVKQKGKSMKTPWIWQYVVLALSIGVIGGTALLRKALLRGLLGKFGAKWTTVIAAVGSIVAVAWLSGMHWGWVTLLGFMAWCTCLQVYAWLYQGEIDKSGWELKKPVK